MKAPRLPPLDVGRPLYGQTRDYGPRIVVLALENCPKGQVLRASLEEASGYCYPSSTHVLVRAHRDIAIGERLEVEELAPTPIPGEPK